MSKYNLIDIYEQYQIGSGWTSDFDYDGMLNTGLGTSIDTPIEVLKKIFEDFTDVNYHREAEHLHYAIEAIEIGDMFEAQGKISDFHAEIKKTQGEQGMDMSDDLGAYMASKMEENEAVDLAIEASQEKAGIEVDESFKSLAKKLDKQKGIDKDEAAKIAGSIAAKKAAGAGKGPTAKQKKRMTEVRIDRDVAERIEGMLSIPLKRKFLDAFMDLWQDLIEEDPFYAEDVINHLNNEMHREIDGFQAQGDRLAGLGENLDDLNDDEYDDGPNGKFVKEINIDKVASPDAKAHDYGAEIKGISDEDDTEEAYAHQTVLPLEEDDYTDRKGRALYPILKAGANATGDEVEMYVQSLSKDIELNGKEQYREFTADDFVEDFKNYIADKSLQEHFKRFM